MAPSLIADPPETTSFIEGKKQQSSISETLSVPVFEAGAANTEDVVQALIRCGGCIVRGVLSTEELKEIETDVRPYLKTDVPWGEVNDFFPTRTTRVTGLIGKSVAFTKYVPGNKLYRDVCDDLLSVSSPAWHGQRRDISVSRPQLNNTIVFSIMPGAKRQELHRDDMIHHNVLPATTADEYKKGRDVSIGFFVAGTKTTKANGATRFIPGSHLWDAEQPPVEELAAQAELNPGDGFIMLASAFHGGSANTTADEERLLYSCFMTKGYLRQVSLRTFI